MATRNHGTGRVAAVLALAILSGCAGRPHGMLIPQEAKAEGSTRVSVLVATTRSSENAKPGEMFTGERSRSVAYAEVAVSLPPDSARKIGEVQWPKSLPGDPSRDFVTVSARTVDAAAARQTLDANIASSKQRNVLVFVHGYNVRFEEAVYQLAQIVHDSAAPVTPVLFTWPSRGRLIEYHYDRESATYSRDALEDTLKSLADDPSVGEVNILAHSMGNWVTVETLRQMSIRNRGLPTKIKNVMLASPDLDIDVFRREMAAIEEGKTRPDFTLFISRDDGALAVSGSLWGSTARVGAIDPAAEPTRTDLRNEGVRVVDMTDVKTDDYLGHGKFAESPEVVRMIGARLASGQAMGDEGAGVGEKLGQVTIGAATTIGKAAGTAISIPVAVVDGRTRDGLADQLQGVGESAFGTVKSATEITRVR